MKILAVGGGSGGHVTPVVAVFRDLKKTDSSLELRFWCDKKFSAQARESMHDFDKTMVVDTIQAGKLRRYHHLTFWQHLTMPSVIFPNIADGARVIAGMVQSIGKLIAWRPDVIFLKGGFVCLPVGWAARLLRIPYVIHDSDAHPGLTNRLLAGSAHKIATGAPLEYYTYPAHKAQYVGIPIDPGFYPRSPEQQRALKASMGFDESKPLIVVTGGGLGAVRLNDAVVLRLTEYTKLGTTVLVTGAQSYDRYYAQVPHDDARFIVRPFVRPAEMMSLLAAADVVVARAGATTLFELAALGRASVLVPNAHLTGGHQVKNAAVYADKAAALVVPEGDDAGTLADDIVDTVARLIEDGALRKQLEEAIVSFAKPDAAHTVAAMLLEVANPLKQEQS